ncbi:hypothetical protein Dshi_0841 [Dinoroseobacter shibae DFL 12 = DSM 16493]|jgi:hypothetical protein|uniref:Uncharacterized protein n=1 Tax=Dinoroseobacter shibae (strain DSM 16493 / NCIMB 14021 / DFL 12) TaxID=398580 RepID=A8LRD6_DINSH|nr:hypothetical protein [Dinoroseobacter shibae]ABV92586.1 hypothetical protein Dshi_0841 [Dinoroseobacter shibae DFL 12 = DSM 16493]URF47530.1 hypothetical protein M8008_04350 [Dinoroseobacter shibae]URF51841.1 hypothetical protein M8007_04350 [Dinoroseobacter shibae]
MTIYILGGSSTVMSGGWADSFATQMVRGQAVRNLAIGAGNTLMSLVRLTEEVTLAPGDTVVWASAIRDVMCLSKGGYRDGGLLRYTEELIRHVGASGARFVPLLMDSIARDLDVRQAPYKAALLDLLHHYGLDWVDVTAEFIRETGMMRVPLSFFDSTGHIIAGSEMSLFIADLAAEAVRSAGGHVRDIAPLRVDPRRPVQVVTRFSPDTRSEAFSNRLLSTTLWTPGIALEPGARPDGDLELEALIVMADPEGGALQVSTASAGFNLSAAAVVDYYRGPFLLSAYVPNLVGAPMPVAAAETLRVDWDATGHDLRSDLLFDPAPQPGPSRARLAAMVFRQAA